MKFILIQFIFISYIRTYDFTLSIIVDQHGFFSLCQLIDHTE